MSLGGNIQYLRKQKKITQEQLAEKMNVSRQTVSRWESDEVTPELGKIVELSELFSCKLDALVRENLRLREDIYSEIEIRRVKPFTMARYVMISPNPEDDVNAYMDSWARNSGLLTMHPGAKRIGWDFPMFPRSCKTGSDCVGMWRPIFFRRALRRTALGWSMKNKRKPITR